MLTFVFCLLCFVTFWSSLNRTTEPRYTRYIYNALYYHCHNPNFLLIQIFLYFAEAAFLFDEGFA